MQQFIRRLATLGIIAAFLLPSTLMAATETVSEPAGQVVGAYSKGSLVDSSSLASHGDGFIHLFERRERHFASQRLVDLIAEAAARMARRYPQGERLQIGDLSARQGGKISRHASHQNGLDVDVVFYRVDHREQTASDGDEGFIESFVKDGKLTSNFDVERNWELIKLFAASGRLGRAFVHPAIKAALCAQARARGELKSQARTLSRIRLLDNHDDHVHVRLTCPSASPACISQEEPPTQTGC
jgi:penicillin-insensitive murein endopeptidase